MATHGKAIRGKGALELIEEAMHALRVCPPAALCFYFIGTLPFVMGFLFFWSEMSRSSFALERSVAGALVMTGLYFWMKVWQGVFCRKLIAQWTPDAEIVKLSARQWFGLIAAQCFLQSVAIPVQLISLVLLLPFGWAYAYFQNLTVFAFTQEPGDAPMRTVYRTAARETRHAPVQNHALIAMGTVFAIFVWMNIHTVLWIAPMLMKQFFGMESVFTTNPGSAILNTTFLAVSIAVAFLCVSPLVKIAYSLRCYYGLSIRSGADLSRQLDSLRERRASLGARALALVAVALFVCGGFEPARGAAAAEGMAPADPVSVEALDESIDEVISRSEFSWRLPRQRSGSDAEGGPVDKFFRETVESVLAFFDTVGDALEKAILWIMEFLLGKDMEMDDRETGEGLDWSMAMMALAVGLGALLIILIIWLIVWAVRRYLNEDLEVEVDGPASAAVDLESEEILASQLPEDEWMKLAREQVERGDFRLAVRALFLASLASLGRKELLRIEKSKSNLDYQRELRMRARSDADLQSAFGDNVSVFERAWYGLHDVSSEAVDRFTRNYERITNHGTSAANA